MGGIDLKEITYRLNRALHYMFKGEMSYGVLFFLRHFCTKEGFVRFRNRKNEKAIHALSKQNRKIKVGFINISSTNWCADSIYRLLEQDERFIPYVIVVPFYNGTESSIKNMYNESLSYFTDKGYRCIATVKDDIYNVKNWEDCESPDIVIYLNPHILSFPNQWKITSFSTKVLTAYIPYGFMAFGGVMSQYNQVTHQLVWKIFAESEISMQMASKYCTYGNENVVMSGYPKMDAFYHTYQGDLSTLWKTDYDVTEVAKIIYSPHHSLKMKEYPKGEICQFSTFDDNYMFMLQYAREHADTTSWIFKPHPLMEKGVVQAGLFDTIEAYQAYVSEWEQLPNARVVTTGTYEDIFMSCDALINDSVSFLSECLYAHKPMLFLRSEGETFNDYGTMLSNIHYSCKGDDTEAIEMFIKDIVIGKNDYEKQKREVFFEQYLDYMKINNVTASEYIYRYLKGVLE